jgi:hypothetical protein
VVVGGDRRRAVARSREAGDETAVGLLGERVVRDGCARAADRLVVVAGVRGALGQLLVRGGHPFAVCGARIVDPLVVEAGQQLAVAGVDRLGGAALGEQPRARAHVDPELVATVQPDGLPGGDQVRRPCAERVAQLRERGAQARTRALVEDVRPEATRELATRVHARPQSEPPSSARARRERGGGSGRPSSSSARPPQSRTRSISEAYVRPARRTQLSRAPSGRRTVAAENRRHVHPPHPRRAPAGRCRGPVRGW